MNTEETIKYIVAGTLLGLFFVGIVNLIISIWTHDWFNLIAGFVYLIPASVIEIK